MKVRKEIVLPSGATVCIRPPRMLDLMSIGDPPVTLAKRKSGDSYSPAEFDWQCKSSRMVLLNCVGTLRFPGQSIAMRIVDKPFDACLSNEMIIEDLSDEDATAILNAVGDLRKEAARAVKSFPEAQEQPAGTPERGADGQNIPPPAV